MEKDLILRGRPCLVNFYKGGPKTIKEAEKQNYICKYLNRCTMHHGSEWACILFLARNLAVESIKTNLSPGEIMSNGFGEIVKSIKLPEGFLYYVHGKLIFIDSDEEDRVRNTIVSEAERILEE